MTQTLMQIRSRIKSISNTKKITNAMEMVAASKLSRVKNRFYSFHAYFSKLEDILKKTLADSEGYDHPLLEKRTEVKNIALAVITSDSGLCGPYNNNVIRAAEDFLKGRDKESVRLITLGREAYGHFRKRGFSILNSYLGIGGHYSPDTVTGMTKSLVDIFLNKEADEAYIAYTYFSSSLRHKAVVEKFLNIERPRPDHSYYIFEPDQKSALDSLIGLYLKNKVGFIMLSSFTSEHSARMFAMKTATDNAQELIDTLTLLRNKVRQGVITKEVLEIAMSAEALKG